MPYNTKILITDQKLVPAPQYYNPNSDAYEVAQGKDGATSVLSPVSITTLQNNANAIGVGTAQTVDGYGVATLQITGSTSPAFVATIQFEGSVDGVNFVPIAAHNRNDGSNALTASAAGIFEVDVRGLQKIRANITAYTSGNITVISRAEAFAGSSHQFSLTGSKVTEGIADFVLNQDGTLLASAPRTTVTYSPNQVNKNARGVRLFLNVTAVGATGGLQVVLRNIDPVSGGGEAIAAAPTAVTAVGLYTYVYYPSALNGADTQNVESVLSRQWLALVAPIDSASYTYSLGYSLIL